MQSSPELSGQAIQHDVDVVYGFPEEIPLFQAVQTHFANYLELLFVEEQRLFELQLVGTREKQMPDLVSYIDTLFQRLNDTVKLGYCYELLDDQQVARYAERLTIWQKHIIHRFEQHERILLEPSLTPFQRSQRIHWCVLGASFLGKSMAP